MTPEGNERNGIVARAEVEALEKRFDDFKRDCSGQNAVLFARLDKLDQRLMDMEKAWWKLAGGMGVVTAAAILIAQWLLKL